MDISEPTDTIIHRNAGATRPEHAPDIAAVCPDCRRIRQFLKAYRQFGYSSLTREGMTESYESAIAGTHQGDIIAMLARRELVDAGIVADEEGAK